MSKHFLSDKKLTEIYQAANAQENGKSYPIGTATVFKAMRAVYDRYHEFFPVPTKKASPERLLGERDPEQFIFFHEQILEAMSKFPLDGKSEIVEQLAWRDQQYHVLYSRYMMNLSGSAEVGSTTTPHTVAGFVGGFHAKHNKLPNDQEIWNAAIRSYKDLNGIKDEK